MLLYQSAAGVLASIGPTEPRVLLADFSWDHLFTYPVTLDQIDAKIATAEPAEADQAALFPPIGSQEVWAAGVTYLRSRTARMDEAAEAGGADFYDRVYNAHRPELFFKATPHRVVGDGGVLHLRDDSKWIVPEPELTLAFTASGHLLGYTIGNDLSCRDIEGENPLYLPQAKTFDRCCGLGPGLLLAEEFPPPETTIHIKIQRANEVLYEDSIAISQMKQTFANLQEHLFRNNSFPHGCYLMTGTGMVPPGEFCLERGDRVSITIEEVGTLTNTLD